MPAANMNCVKTQTDFDLFYGFTPQGFPKIIHT